MSSLVAVVGHLGLGAVFAAIFAEQCGLPVPGFLILVVAGAGAAAGGPTGESVVAIAVVACVLADLAWYVAGKHFGSRLLKGMCRLSLEPDSCVSNTEHVFERLGTGSLLIAKFVPGLGAAATAMSGVIRVRLVVFLAFDLMGSLIWASTAVLLLGSVFHAAIADVFVEVAQLGRTGLVLIAAALAGYFGLKLWRRQQFFRELRMSRITVEELRRLIADGANPSIIDARPRASQIREGMIPGAVAFEALSDDLDPMLPTSEVVVYCACPNEASAARVAKQIIGKGFKRVRPLEGGIHAWQSAGYDLVRGQ